MTSKGEPFFLLTPIRGTVRLHSPCAATAFSFIFFKRYLLVSLSQDVFPGKLSIFSKIHHGQSAECPALKVALLFLLVTVLGRLVLHPVHSVWVAMGSSLSLCTSAFLPALTKITTGNHTTGKSVICCLTTGWAGSELGKEWSFFDPTHAIDLIYCKARTGQNVSSPLEQERNQ